MSVARLAGAPKTSVNRAGIAEVPAQELDRLRRERPPIVVPSSVIPVP